MPPRSSITAVLVGVVAGIVSFLVAGTGAQAAQAAEATQLPIIISSSGLGTEVVGLVDDMARTLVHGGGLCLDGLYSVGSLFGLDPRHSADAMECHDLRGVGFAFLGLAAVVVIAVGRMRLATEQRRLEVARRLIEKGFEPPDGLFNAPARRDLRKGVVLVFAGLGLVISGMMLGDRGMAAGGLIPAFIGIGYLVSYRLATDEANADARREEALHGHDREVG